MNGYQIGGLLLVLYTILVYVIAYFKPDTLWKIVKLKLGRKTSDKTAEIFMYVFGTIVLFIGIYLFTL